MQKIPLIAIIGRPNVGKSSLFNAIINNKTSIVSDESGVTRDRIYADTEFAGRKFTLVDTGGLDFDTTSNIFSAHIKEQVDIAISLADCIIFLCDGVVGAIQDDHEIARLLRRTRKPILLAVNKLDSQAREAEHLYDFYKLSLGDPYPISCTQKTGLGDLIEAALEKIDKGPQTNEDEVSAPVRIAIVGKPNAGKSSIVNKLLSQKRVLVSEQAGTTRDSIDTPFKYEGKQYILTDTAGIRRKSNIETATIEHYSVLRALMAIRNSDVCVLVVDGVVGLTEQDVRLAGYIDELGKPSIIAINKWDAVEKDAYTMQKFEKNLSRDLAFMSYFVSIYISALTGQRVNEIMNAVNKVLANAGTRISTGTLNTLFAQFITNNPPPLVGARRPKFKYATQVGTHPPTFALFLNDKNIVQKSYLRYIENNLRKAVEFSGTPIKIYLRSSSKKDDST